MQDPLYVHFRDRFVGVITLNASGSMQFRYDQSWLERSDCFPISLSLPLDRSIEDAADNHFFANLLPEGMVREQICRSLKISQDNDFELLKAIGGDCAGALTITTSDSPLSHEQSPQYEPVSEEQLAHWSAGTSGAFSTVTGQNAVRLSLAGAQDKLPVYVNGDQIFIPGANTPSTHILKFTSPHFSHLPENETFITLLAQEVGLPVVEVRIRRTAKAAVTLITRYDRRQDSGQWLRLHQEDFCQALGIRASQKYEKEGGPNLRQCAEIIRQHAAYPLADLQKLLQWTLFNLLVGNADAHGKNLSMLYSSSGSPVLAPFYDLVCTRNYRTISREMAMNLGGAWNPDLVTTKHLEGLAKDFGFRFSIVSDNVSQLTMRILDSLPAVVEKYGSQFGKSSVLERLPIVIHKIVRRIGTQISQANH